MTPNNWVTRSFLPQTFLFLISLLPVAVVAETQVPEKSTSSAASASRQLPKPVDLDIVLAASKGGERVSLADLVAELQRAPADTRKNILSRKEMVEQLASNLLQRRMLANQALKSKLAKDPVVVAAVELARERVLSDIELATYDGQNMPSESSLDSQARAAYAANTSRFDRPAESRAKHILITTKGNEGRAKAQELLTKLRAGASFDELAKSNSQDPGSAAKGGDLGFFGAGVMVKPFEDAVNKLQKPGELSEVVETQFGYHIIQLTERREKGVLPYKDVADQLRAESRAAILRDARTRLAQDLSKSITVDQAMVDLVTKSESSY